MVLFCSEYNVPSGLIADPELNLISDKAENYVN
jgi:hypothetical protein